MTFQAYLRSRWAKLLVFVSIATGLAFFSFNFATQISFHTQKWTHASGASPKVPGSGTERGENRGTDGSSEQLPTVDTPVQSEPLPDSLPVASEKELDYWIWETHSRFRSHSQVLAYDKNASLDECAGFPTYILSDIQVSLRIGINSDKAKVDAQLSSVTRCIENLLIFSDLDDQLGDRRVYDVLAELPHIYRLENPDFDTYDKQKQLRADGLLEHSNPEGWKLDRFKFLPMMEKAFEMRPNAKWYVFMEDDTYFFWDNLFRFLDNLDPDTPKYMGSPSPGKETADGLKTWFAYGGTGHVVSRAAMEKLLARNVGPYGEYTEPSLSARYVQEIKEDCCGDSILGWALWNAGVPLSGHWPSFCPHPIGGIPYSELYWCEPVLSLHRSLPQDMIGLWKWEQERRHHHQHPLRFTDLIGYFDPTGQETRDDWENADWDGFRDPDDSPAHSSFDSCKVACKQNPRCMQYNYHAKKCTFVSSIRFGWPRQPAGDGTPDENRFLAGWDLEKIERWEYEHHCDDAHWVKPSIERIY